LHASQPVPATNLAVASSSGGTSFAWLGGGSKGCEHWGQLRRTSRRPITPIRLDASMKGSISMLISRVNAPAETPE